MTEGVDALLPGAPPEPEAAGAGLGVAGAAGAGPAAEPLGGVVLEGAATVLEASVGPTEASGLSTGPTMTCPSTISVPFTQPKARMKNPATAMPPRSNR